MSAALTHYLNKIAEKGLGGIISGRLRWYKQSLQIDNWLVGRLVELAGNKIKIQDGVILSVDNPLVTTLHKSSMYFGIYEMSERRLSKRYIDPSLPVVEIGASIGGVACTTSRLLKDPSRHVVLECNPMIISTLEKNRDLNHCKFAIEPVALAYGSDTISFAVDLGHFMMGSLSRQDGKLVTVQTTTLEKLLKKYDFGTINLISDSEGAEVDMVENELDIIRRHVKCIIVETHAQLRGEQPVSDMISKLVNAGFNIEERGEDTLALINQNL
jgi:FkbM family methyltransferase